MEIVRVKARFFGTRLWTVIIVPAHFRWQRHEDGFNAANARLQTEERAPVVHEVELNVASAPLLLKAFFTLAVWCLLALLHKRQIRRQIAVTHGLHEGEALRKTPFIQVIVKQAADTAWFLAMLQEEIVIAVLLEFRIHIVDERCACGFRRVVPVAAIFIKTIIRCQIVTAAKPPHRFDARFFRNEEADVRV